MVKIQSVTKKCKRSINTYNMAQKCMLFTIVMKNIFKYTLSRYAIALLWVFVFSCCSTHDSDFSERTKITLRNTNN